MFEQPLISVVIPTYNRAEKVIRAVRSVLAQTYENIEVIVVNDGSRDSTREALAQIRDPRVSVISQPNRGLSEARNTGVAHARGPWLAFLDDDDTWMPRKSERQFAYMETHNSLASVMDFFMQAGGETTRYERKNSKSNIRWKILTGDGLCFGSSMLVRRDVFDAVGGFNSKTTRTEDWDWLLRLHRRFPGSLAIVPEALVVVNGAHKAALHIEIASMEAIKEKHASESRQIPNREARTIRAAIFWKIARLKFDNRYYAGTASALAAAAWHSPMDTARYGSSIIGGRVIAPWRKRLSRLTIRRAVDKTISGMAIPVLSLAIAVARTITQRDPIFRQERVGLNEKPFQILKFRTMVDDPTSPTGQRITRVGRILRATALDETPQFFNIWRGEMTLIGPRPVALNEHAIGMAREGARWAERNTVPPGLIATSVIAEKQSGAGYSDTRIRLDADLDYIGRLKSRGAVWQNLRLAWAALAVASTGRVDTQARVRGPSMPEPVAQVHQTRVHL